MMSAQTTARRSRSVRVDVVALRAVPVFRRAVLATTIERRLTMTNIALEVAKCRYALAREQVCAFFFAFFFAVCAFVVDVDSVARRKQMITTAHTARCKLQSVKQALVCYREAALI